MGADPGMLERIDEEAAAYLELITEDPFFRQVMEKIAQRLPDGPPSQARIADDLHVSERTLQRKLKAEGHTYKDILQDYRLRLARNYLSQPGRSIVETSYVLGFSDPSAFSRAFKGWTGHSPAEYREQYL